MVGRDSYKGMGVDFGDLERRRHPRHLRQQHRRRVRPGGEPFRLPGDRRGGADEKGVAPYHDESERLGLSRSSWGWDAKIADFDNDGSVEVIQAVGFLRGATDRWPELQELAMGNDEFLRDPSNWPRFGPGDDLSGHDRNRFAVAPRGRFWEIAEDLGLSEPGVSRGIAVADVDGDGALDFAVANQWAASSFYRNKGAPAGRSWGCTCCCRSTATDPGRPDRGRGIPAATSSGGPPSGRRPGSGCRTAVCCKPRSTAATATRASGASTCISGSARRIRTPRWKSS